VQTQRARVHLASAYVLRGKYGMEFSVSRHVLRITTALDPAYQSDGIKTLPAIVAAYNLAAMAAPQVRAILLRPRR
jgi:hypothetical protein